MPIFGFKKTEESRITLQEASVLTPYDSNYLGLLVRNKRLSAVKVKGVWMTTKNEVQRYLREHGDIRLQKDLGKWKHTALIFFILLPLVLLAGILLEVFGFWASEGYNTSEEDMVQNKAFVSVTSAGSDTPIMSFFEGENEVRVSVLKKKTP